MAAPTMKNFLSSLVSLREGQLRDDRYARAMELEVWIRGFAIVWFTLCAGGTPLDASEIPENVIIVLEQRCGECHSGAGAELELPFEAWKELELDSRLEWMNQVQEQVFFKTMPPYDADPLTADERDRVLGWLATELNRHEASRLKEKLTRPEFGNYTDHESLFSGEFAGLPGFTYDRRWLISEFIFDAKVNRLLDHQGMRTIDGVATQVEGDNGVNLGTRFGGQSVRQSITNPFLLPSTIGVRYFSQEGLTGGHLLTMVSNAKKIARYMTLEPTLKNNYPSMSRLMELEFEQRRILERREKFLSHHVEHLLRDVFGDRHETMLPRFKPVDIEDPPVITNADGSVRRETNLGLLDRFDDDDLRAIYIGMGLYDREGRSVEEVIRDCERDWFFHGVHQKRIENRVSIMKVLHARWDIDAVKEDIRKKNLQPEEYRPLSDEEMLVVRDSLLKNRNAGDTFQQVIDQCLRQWAGDFAIELERVSQVTDAELIAVIEELYLKIFERSPSLEEREEGVQLTRSFLEKLDRQQAFAKLIESLILSSEFAYRYEFGEGEADQEGRRRMSARNASYAIAYALRDSGPDETLRKAVAEGRLETREDYRREVERILKERDHYVVIDETVQKSGFNSSITNQPIRKVRFFREFFGYPKAMTVFKDDARFGAGRHDGTVGRLVDEADMLVSHILEKDQDVFEELLTTDRFYVFHSGDNEEMQRASDRLRSIYDYFRQYDWHDFDQEQLYEHWPFIKKMQMRGTVFPDFETNQRRRSDWVRSFKRTMESLELRFGNGQKNAIPYDELPMAYWHQGNATGRTGQVMRAHEVTTYFNVDYRDWDYPAIQPARMPHRHGMLTHPAWLIAHSLNTETDPVRRGKWIRQKLLAGTVPDVPISVDAVVPEDPHRTLRERLQERTGEAYCWQCHQKMDPLGLPFESFDDFGRFRTEERLEHAENLVTPAKQAPVIEGIQVDIYKTLPVVTRGHIDGIDEPSIEGEVDDAFEMVDRLARSTRVRQSLIRHAFRYFLGRNETLSDSKTLIEAEQAYLESGGSFDAVVVSLLTSDSFIYRKPIEK
jgi:hypothetical protein